MLGDKDPKGRLPFEAGVIFKIKQRKFQMATS